jgi:mannose-6-phosphate isomerase-like protein (cupin superfamily)
VHLRPRTSHHGTTVVPLTRRPGGIQAFKMVYPPRTPPEDAELKVHEGYDWLYVLSGRMRVVLGEHDVVLSPGEVAEFDTRTPHWLGNPFDEPAEVLGLFGPQGERLHVRARPATNGL